MFLTTDWPGRINTVSLKSSWNKSRRAALVSNDTFSGACAGWSPRYLNTATDTPIATTVKVISEITIAGKNSSWCSLRGLTTGSNQLTKL